MAQRGPNEIYSKCKTFTRRQDGSWRVRINAELEKLFAQPNVISETKTRFGKNGRGSETEESLSGSAH